MKERVIRLWNDCAERAGEKPPSNHTKANALILPGPAREPGVSDRLGGFGEIRVKSDCFPRLFRIYLFSRELKQTKGCCQNRKNLFVRLNRFPWNEG
ncbi:hypothetical protein chiPu_0001708 [Chiloscyllium punctatum]|uniref:Uncharacterized protein n=1 Tax=Chiloscyllium punctatum TaxID=137246 RepID=A0A401RYS4_CHIPU|nr:hypothetical protein [Chiloscyllium punctatum]